MIKPELKSLIYFKYTKKLAAGRNQQFVNSSVYNRFLFIRWKSR